MDGQTKFLIFINILQSAIIIKQNQDIIKNKLALNSKELFVQNQLAKMCS